MIGILRVAYRHMEDFIQRLPELYSDPTNGSLSHTRIGMIIAGFVFSIKMLAHLPDSWELWATYMGTVGGYAIARQMVAAKHPPPTGGEE